MCCAFVILVTLGPRFFSVLWWLVDQNKWNRTFDTFILPFLGVLFIPWTTLMYVIVAPGGVNGWDWLWIGLALLSDIASYASGGYNQRNRIPGYGSTTPSSPAQ
jgi:hypothetical protein